MKIKKSYTVAQIEWWLISCYGKKFSSYEIKCYIEKIIFVIVCKIKFHLRLAIVHISGLGYPNFLVCFNERVLFVLQLTIPYIERDLFV